MAQVEYRVFYAHKKEREDENPQFTDNTKPGYLDLIDVISAPIRVKNPTIDFRVKVTLGAEDWRLNWSACGGWGPWCRRVGEGTLYGGTPTYDAYVVPDRVVGKATADILGYALAAQRTVLFYDPGGKDTAGSITRVTGVALLNEDYRSHATLVLGATIT